MWKRQLKAQCVLWLTECKSVTQVQRRSNRIECRPYDIKIYPSMGRTLKETGASVFQTNCDEAHFWLNGYVNKQNCRIWSEANPQVHVETTLHPEKLTVWCALWAGGIRLQKR
ncbi:uncharacterized protein TNCV_1110971 [Trichonephila clavipes]|nr:uncharacterized protein TNCV_1110971 [Trichonephila clavipes]